MLDKLTIILWLIFFTLIGCVLIIGPSVVSVDQSVKRPIIEADDTLIDSLEKIDWIEW